MVQGVGPLDQGRSGPELCGMGNALVGKLLFKDCALPGQHGAVAAWHPRGIVFVHAQRSWVGTPGGQGPRIPVLHEGMGSLASLPFPTTMGGVAPYAGMMYLQPNVSSLLLRAFGPH